MDPGMMAFRPYDFDTPSAPRRPTNSAQHDWNSHQTDLTGKDGATLQRELFTRIECQPNDPSAFPTEERVATSRLNGAKVIIKKTLRSSILDAASIDKEINVLSTVQDQAIPFLVESIELRDVIWTVKEFRSLQTVGELVRTHGPVADEVMRPVLNQLFSATASLFLAGFAHLRICDTTVSLDPNFQVMITDFQYTCEYGKEKEDKLYAGTQEKYGDDIYVAPEVFSSNTYNARKAVIWSCGVLVYFMATGQTDKLSNLDHPSFSHTTPQPPPQTDPFTNHPSTLPDTPKPRTRLSYTSTNNQLPISIIHYPGTTRLDVPNYIRAIVPRMLTPDPIRRPELIEIASRVPKDFSNKATRPLMEVAWQDYKTHVGPLAIGSNLDLDTASTTNNSVWGGGGGEGYESSLNGNSVNGRSRASSIYSIASAVSNPFKSLMERRSSKSGGGYEGGMGSGRRVSAPVGAGGSNGKTPVIRWG